MKIADIYDVYLRTSDLQKPVQVKIAQVTVKTFKGQNGDETRKIVLSFEHAKRLMVLNKTQARGVESATGCDEVERWPGKTVVLSAGKAVNGQPTILVSPAPAPAAGADPLTAGGDDGKNKTG